MKELILAGFLSVSNNVTINPNTFKAFYDVPSSRMVSCVQLVEPTEDQDMICWFFTNDMVVPITLPPGAEDIKVNKQL